MTNSVLPILTLTLLFLAQTHAATLPTPTAAKPFFCVKCLQQGALCKPALATSCGVCKPFVTSETQPATCRDTVCHFCRGADQNKRVVCHSATILTSLCPSSTPAVLSDDISVPAAAPAKLGRRRASPPACSWHGAESHVVIPFSAVVPADGWKPMSRDGHPGLVYRDGRGKGMDEANKDNKICFDVVAPVHGDYFLNVVGHSPFGAASKNVWVRCSKGFRDAGKFEWTMLDAPSELGKEYNTFREDSRFGGASAHDPLLIWNVSAGETMNFCVSGASWQFEMFSLVVGRCEDFTCYLNISYDIQSLPMSQCLPVDTPSS